MSFHVPYIRGDRYKVDHGFGLFLNNTSGPPGVFNYPAGVDFNTYMKWVWRVRRWNYGGSMRVFSDTGDITVPDTTIDLYDISQTTILTDERRALSDNLMFGFGAENGGFYFADFITINYAGSLFSWTPGPHPATLLMELQPAGGPLGGGSEVKYDPSALLFYVPTLMTLDIYMTSSGPPSPSDIEITTHTTTNLPTNSFIIDETDFPIGVAHGPSFSSMALSNVPSEFWPYRNRANAPVYDTSTGAIINDPFG